MTETWDAEIHLQRVRCDLATKQQQFMKVETNDVEINLKCSALSRV